MKKIISSSALALMVLSLVACGGKQSKKDQSVSLDFPLIWDSKKQPLEGGTVKVAVVQSSPFKGLLIKSLYEDSVDSYFLSPLTGALFLTDGNFEITDGGMANMKFDVENKVINVKFREGLKWEDGHPLTVDDYIFAYELIAHPDYTGVRYDAGMRNVVGIEEYHAGKAKTIKGLEKISDTELNIHLVQALPTVRTGGGGLSTFIEPKHYLKDIPVKDLQTSKKVRIKPLSYGPYKIKQIIPGESIEYEKNDQYYEAHLLKNDKMIRKIIPDSSVIASMKTGEYDIYLNVNENLYLDYKHFDNLQTLGRTALYYQYLGFNLGKYENGVNITNPNAKMFNLNLRKAMGFAANYELITKNLYNGLRKRANSIIPPVFKDIYNDKVRISYDPEKAKQLLDEAGYKDIDGDGFREDPKGNKLEIFFAFPNQGPDLTEPLSQQLLQDWKAVGLNVSLTTGRAMEGNAFFDKVRANADDVDVFVAAWGVGSNFDPSGIYGKKAAFNFSRLTSEKNEELISKINSEESLRNPDYKKKAIREWEDNYMENELGFTPVTFRYELQPVNKRINYYSYSYDNTIGLDIPSGVTQDQPFVSTK